MTDVLPEAPELAILVHARRYEKGVFEERNISCAREIPYTLFVNDREIMSIATLPCDLGELFIGFLVSEGVLVRRSELRDVAIDHSARIVRFEVDAPEERLSVLGNKGMLTSGCAGGVLFSVGYESSVRRTDEPGQIRASEICARMVDLDTRPGLYKTTRGVHAASLADRGGTLLVREDLGRHNAIDKIVGACFQRDIPTRDKMLLTTGRVTSDALTKASRGGFPVIISRSSASAAALAIGGRVGVDVVTYVRGGKFNWFSHGGVSIIP